MCSGHREDAAMHRDEEPLLDAELVDTVASGEELIMRAQALAHETEERLQTLTGADPSHEEQAHPPDESAGTTPAAPEP
jgi:hypothetical protein